MSANNLIHANGMKRKSIAGNVNIYLNKLNILMLEATDSGKYFIKIPSNEVIQEVKDELIKLGYKVIHHMEQATISWE